jgi:hypothetical protein
MFLPHIAISQDIPVYRDNEIAGYLYETVPNINQAEDCYLADTLTVLGKKIIVHTGVSYFTTDGGMDLFSPVTTVEVEEMNNDTAIIKFQEERVGANVFGISVKKDASGNIRIYNLFSFDTNFPDEICIAKVDRLLDEKIIFTHTGNDTFEMPVCQ